MAILKSNPNRKMTIDLSGPEGNAFCLLGIAKREGKRLGLNTDAIRVEMTSGDYENLIQVFDQYFGNYVDLVR